MIFVRSLVSRQTSLEPLTIVAPVGQNYQDKYLLEIGATANPLFSPSGLLRVEAQVDELNNGNWQNEGSSVPTVSATGGTLAPFRLLVGSTRTYQQGARVRVRLVDDSTGIAGPWTTSSLTTFTKWLIGVNQLPSYSVTFLFNLPYAPDPDFFYSRHDVALTSPGNYDPGLNYFGMRSSFRYETEPPDGNFDAELSTTTFVARVGEYDIVWEAALFTGLERQRIYNAVLFDGTNGIQQNP